MRQIFPPDPIILVKSAIIAIEYSVCGVYLASASVCGRHAGGTVSVSGDLGTELLRVCVHPPVVRRPASKNMLASDN